MEKQMDGLCDAMRVMARYFKGDCPVRRVQVFLRVAQFEPVTLEEVARGINAPNGTVYDDLKALGKRTVAGKSGALLVNEVANTQGGAH